MMCVMEFTSLMSLLRGEKTSNRDKSNTAPNALLLRFLSFLGSVKYDMTKMSVGEWDLFIDPFVDFTIGVTVRVDEKDTICADKK